ncbi:MAG: Rossmann-like and DUF2520 domain-containing protein [Halothermotrichaceae bacterium]
MKAIVIGAGRVGTSFAYLLQKKDIDVLGVYNKHYDSAKKAVNNIETGKPYRWQQLKEEVNKANLLIFTTPDDVIKDMYHKLDIDNDQYIMHMSGILSSSIFKNNNNNGLFSMHPLQSVASFSEGIKVLPETLFTIEGNDRGINFAKKLVELLDVDYKIIDTKYKPLYHASAVIASNYLVTLLNGSYRLLEEANLSDRDIHKGILNLVRGTLNNIEKMGVESALTGPICRGDKKTIKIHQEAIRQFAPQYYEMYQILGKYTLELVNGNGIKKLFDNKGYENKN